MAEIVHGVAWNPWRIEALALCRKRILPQPGDFASFAAAGRFHEPPATRLEKVRSMARSIRPFLVLLCLAGTLVVCQASDPVVKKGIGILANFSTCG